MPSNKDNSIPNVSSSENIDEVDRIKDGSHVSPKDKEKLFKGAPESDVEVLGENQKSLILQIIGQLRFGMDMTKILIPVDFLEPRSLLEKLTDFASHADIIVNATKPDEPEERMLQIVKWYLSGWHIKPKGVKKPYNPALGEIFRCQFQTSDGSKTAFFAEQVTHHPPVSALYAENKEHQMAFEGWYYPRSKFLGNSAASVAEGVCNIYLKSRGEKYVATWPDIYARGLIFGKLVMELASKTKIECKETGLSAEMDFKAKPWFGGEYHSVQAKIKKGSKVLYTLKGKWNDKIYIKKKGDKEQLFLNTNTEKIIHKKIPAFEDQLPNESRKVWVYLSKAIRDNDIVQAADEKFRVEEIQRRNVKEREEKKESYKPKFFKDDGNKFWKFVGHDEEEFKYIYSDFKEQESPVIKDSEIPPREMDGLIKATTKKEDEKK